MEETDDEEEPTEEPTQEDMAFIGQDEVEEGNHRQLQQLQEADDDTLILRA